MTSCIIGYNQTGILGAPECDMNHVSYKGTAPVLNDLMGGQIDVTFEAANRES
jgi:tripartite-type tricarboxylate transporter receptor subunit TctC